jgi:putative aldouronate transport system permease protein
MRILISVPLTILINFMGSYSLSKNYLPGRRFMVFLLLVPMYISAGLIPTFILYAEIGLLNNFWVYVLPVGFNFFFFILLRTYMYTMCRYYSTGSRIGTHFSAH